MGVYINMEMPKSCSECFVKSCNGRAKNKRLMVQRGEDCPLVPVPEHGRLIDAKYVRDKIIQKWMDKADDSHMYKCGMEDAYEVIRNAPTIIPASKEGEA